MDGTMPLLRAARDGDREAAGRMVEENAGLIWSVARRFFGRGVEPDDLFQIGCLGFLKAIRGFDEDFGTRFSTYAVPTGFGWGKLRKRGFPYDTQTGPIPCNSSAFRKRTK